MLWCFTVSCCSSVSSLSECCSTGWRRLVGSPKLQIISHKRATKYRSRLQKMTYRDKGSHESSPPCSVLRKWQWHREGVLRYCVAVVSVVCSNVAVAFCGSGSEIEEVGGCLTPITFTFHFILSLTPITQPYGYEPRLMSSVLHLSQFLREVGGCG